jgi:hypothetical protein
MMGDGLLMIEQRRLANVYKKKRANRPLSLLGRVPAVPDADGLLVRPICRAQVALVVRASLGKRWSARRDKVRMWRLVFFGASRCRLERMPDLTRKGWCIFVYDGQGGCISVMPIGELSS